MPTIAKTGSLIPPIVLEKRGPRVDWPRSKERQQITDGEKLELIAAHYPAIRAFIDMARIASPTITLGDPHENEMRTNMAKVADVIAEQYQKLDIPKRNITFDPLGVQIINVPGTNGFKNKRRIMFVGHRDIVPADLKNPAKPVNPKLILHETPEGEKLYIATDGTTTLGADDKASLASIWEAVRLLKENKIPHVPLDIVIAPDEESGNESLYKLDTSKLRARQVIIADHFMDFCVGYGCSSYSSINIKITGLTGGHNGVEVHKNLNAAVVINELFNRIGDGVIADDPNQPGTPLISKTAHVFGVKPSPGGAIPSDADYSITLRSRDKKLEDKEIRKIRMMAREVERKYRGLESNLRIKVQVERWPAWLGRKNSPLVRLLEDSAHEIGHDEIFSGVGHGFTQGNILCTKRNYYGEEFELAIAGPDVEKLHSVEEKTGVQSIIDVGEWFSKTIEKFSATKKLSG